MRFRGKPLFQCKVPRTGLHYNVELEWELACHWYRTYTREQFQALSGNDQSRIVALYKVATYIDAVLAQAQAEEMKRNSGR